MARDEARIYGAVDGPFMPGGHRRPPPWTAEDVGAVLVSMEAMWATPAPTDLSPADDGLFELGDVIAVDPVPVIESRQVTTEWIEELGIPTG
jgi:hypothetical protein